MKTASIIYCIILVFVYVLVPKDVAISLGVQNDCGVLNHILYSLFHYNEMHLFLNIYVILSVVFFHNVNIFKFCFALIAAMLLPSEAALDSVCIGSSVFAYALIGIEVMISDEWKKFAYLNLFIISIGTLFNNIAVLPHFWGFGCGCLYGILTAKRYGGK